jgi:hypothetical protein
MNADVLAAWLIIAVVALWLAVFVARELWTEWRIQRAERQWRAWFDALPEPERWAGARKLLEDVRSIDDDLAAERLRADLDAWGQQS